MDDWMTRTWRAQEAPSRDMEIGSHRGLGDGWGTVTVVLKVKLV